MTAPGRVWQQVEEVLSAASTCVTLVAPFIKTEIFEAALAAIPQNVSNIRCITRWSVMEIAAGVSDPEVINIAEQDGRPEIMLCHDLHAKLYLGDDRCLVGSANLTGKATGRVQPENLEVLVEVPAAHGEVQALLARIESRAVLATSELAVSLREQAKLLKESESHGVVVISDESEQESGWYPKTRAPQRLYSVYRGRGGSYPRHIREAIVTDLAYLDLPPGLDERSFAQEIKSRLRVMPEIRSLFTSSRLTSDDLEQKIAESTNVTEDETKRAAENLAAWLEYFDDVHTVPGSWEIRQGRELR